MGLSAFALGQWSSTTPCKHSAEQKKHSDVICLCPGSETVKYLSKAWSLKRRSRALDLQKASSGNGSYGSSKDLEMGRE